MMKTDVRSALYAGLIVACIGIPVNFLLIFLIYLPPLQFVANLLVGIGAGVLFAYLAHKKADTEVKFIGYAVGGAIAGVIETSLSTITNSAMFRFRNFGIDSFFPLSSSISILFWGALHAIPRGIILGAVCAGIYALIAGYITNKSGTRTKIPLLTYILCGIGGYWMLLGAGEFFGNNNVMGLYFRICPASILLVIAFVIFKDKNKE